MRARRLRRSLRTGLLAAALPALGAAALPTAAAAQEELGPPGRPMLVEPEEPGVVVEGLLREEAQDGAAPRLVLEGLDGRVYAIGNAEVTRVLEKRVGERLVVEGTVKDVPDGRDVLRVRSVRFGGR